MDDNLKILDEGDARLRKESDPWDFSASSDESLTSLLSQMKRLMQVGEGVGLSAPQVGINKQVFIVRVQDSRRYPSLPSVPFRVFINPKILRVSRRTGYFVEGCLSVVGIRVGLRRSKWVWVSWQDSSGRRYSSKLSGVLARIFLHEFDHLRGVLISDYLDL
jgi:peptide deformylase